MYFSRTAFHPPVFDLSEHVAAVESALPALAQDRVAAQPAAATSPDWIELPVTTVSLNANFDAYINVYFQGAPASSAVPLVVDSGNTMLIMPRWEDLQSLPNYATDYQDLGTATEPWGCPAKVMRGPIVITTSSGAAYTIANCVFYACTADSPTELARTANFGAGCINPWTAGGWNSPSGIAVIMQAPLSYDPNYPFLEFNFAAVEDVHGPVNTPLVDGGSSLKLYREAPDGYQIFNILPNQEWMALTPKSLTIGGVLTGWPGDVAAPIAMIDTGGGPVYLSDPNGYLYNRKWPHPVQNPCWASNSTQCESTEETISIELGDANSSYKYTIDTSSLPHDVQGLTLVMCQMNSYMMGQNGMNIGGISALMNTILVDYRNSRVGLKPR